MSNGPILSIFSPQSQNIELLLTMNPLNQIITTLSWCSGFDADGQTPIQLLITTRSLGLVYDFSKKRNIASFSTDRSIVSSIWSIISSDIFFIGDANYNVTCFKITGDSFKVLWTNEIQFSPDFLSISPFDSNSLLVSSKFGLFKILSTRSGETINLGGKFPVDDEPLHNVRFYPFLNNTLLFVDKTGIFIYTLADKALIKVIGSEMGHERIFNIFFDETDETIFSLVHNTHIRNYDVFNNGIIRGRHITYLSQPKNNICSLITASYYRNKIAVLSAGGYLQIFEYKEHDILLQCVYKMLPSKPNDFDVYNNSLITGSKSGYVSITNESKIIKFFQIYDGKIIRIVWLNDNKFVSVIKTVDNKIKSFFYDVNSMKSVSLLRSSLVSLETSIDLIVSKNRKYFALVISGYIILLFKETKNFATIIEQTQVIATFSDVYDEEIINITPKGIGKKYLLSPDNPNESYNLLKKIDFNIIKLNEHLTVIKALNDHLICGTNHGDIIIIDWFGGNPVSIPFLKKQITSIEILGNKIYICDISNSTGLIKYENDCYRIEFINDENCVEKIKWVDSNRILIRKPSQPTLTVLSADTFLTVSHPNEINNLTKEEFITELKNDKEKDLSTICNLASKSGYHLLSILLLSLSPTQFTSNCFCANFNVERIRSFLDVINGMLTLSSHKILRVRKARLDLLLGNNEEAINLFLDSPSDNPNFIVDSIKVCFFNSKDSTHSIAPSVAALIDSNNISDAVDILIITEQYKEAVKLLLTTGNVEEVLEIAKIRMNKEEIEAILDSLVRTLLIGNQFVQAASVMIACRKFDEAAKIIRKNGFDFVANVLEAMEFQENNLLRFKLDE